jgi:hypothetical protein
MTIGGDLSVAGDFDEVDVMPREHRRDVGKSLTPYQLLSSKEQLQAPDQEVHKFFAAKPRFGPDDCSATSFAKRMACDGNPWWNMDGTTKCWRGLGL